MRYCKELKFAERLFYGEITALTNRNGYCFATNKYFAELYNVTTETISRWISHLQRLGFIKVEIIKTEKNEILERRIFIVDDSNNTSVSNTYCQNNQYPIDEKVKYNNINIRIDRFFNFIIKRKGKNPEKMTDEQQMQFFKIMQMLEFNYTEEILKTITKENIEKLQVIIYALKELLISNKSILLTKVTREEIIFVYDNCKKVEQKYKDTSKAINNFFEYYYSSLIRKLEKAK